VTSCTALHFLLQGNTESACSIYEEALKMATTEENLHALPILCVHFSRLKYIVGIMYLSDIRNLTICFGCYHKYFDYDRNHTISVFVFLRIFISSNYFFLFLYLSSRLY